MLRRLSFILFYVKEVLAEGLDSIMTSLEGLDFGDVAELSPSAAVLLVEDVLVRVDYPDHFFFRLVIKQVVLYCSTSLDRVEIRQREGFTEIVLLLAIIWA